MPKTKQENHITILDLKAALEPITREVNDLRRELAALKLDMSPLKESAAKSHKYLFGNGDAIGIDEQVRDITRTLNEMRGALRWLAVTIGGAIIVIAVTRIFN